MWKYIWSLFWVEIVSILIMAAIVGAVMLTAAANVDANLMEMC